MTIPTPAIGRIVHYTLSEADAEAVNRRRADAVRSMPARRDAIAAAEAPTVGSRAAAGDASIGSQVHVGNRAAEGDVYPMLIVRVWNEDAGTVNGQVYLDGNDTLWVTSVTPGDGPRSWAWPPRV